MRVGLKGVAGVVVGAVVMALGACSDPSVDAQSALQKLGVAESPQEVIAAGVLHTDDEATFGAAYSEAYLKLLFGMQGYSAADAECAVTSVRTALGEARFDSLTNADLRRFMVRFKAEATAAEKCASSESAPRIAAAKAAAKAASSPSTTVAGATSTTPTTATPTSVDPAANAAPDIPASAVRVVFSTMYANDAASMGLTTKESACIVGELVNDRSDEQLIAMLKGGDAPTPAKSKGLIDRCVTAERQAVLAPKIAQKIVDIRERDKKLHDQRQEQLNRELDQMNASTTTTTVAPS
jgi:hypothetical protein